MLIFSYAGAIAHSILPHHHHVSHKEAKEHHHHDNTSHSHGDSSKKDKGNEQEPYFLTHASNADVVTNHVSSDGSVKAKKIQFEVLQSVPMVYFVLGDHNIFHPPSDDLFSPILVFHSRSLRAPPVLS